MLKIRLARVGRKNQPFFRIVVMDSRSKQGGRAVEIVGWYDPLLKGNKRLNIKKERIDYWLGVGAQMSDGAKKILLSVEDKKKIWPDKISKKKQKELKDSVTIKDDKIEKDVKKESVKKEPQDKAKDDKKSKAESKED